LTTGIGGSTKVVLNIRLVSNEFSSQEIARQSYAPPTFARKWDSLKGPKAVHLTAR